MERIDTYSCPDCGSISHYMPCGKRTFQVGITLWQGRFAVFAAEMGHAPPMALATIDNLDCAPRQHWGDSLLNTAEEFAHEIGLSFGDDVMCILTINSFGWGLWEFCPEAEKAAENRWHLVSHQERS